MPEFSSALIKICAAAKSFARAMKLFSRRAELASPAAIKSCSRVEFALLISDHFLSSAEARTLGAGQILIDDDDVDARR